MLDEEEPFVFRRLYLRARVERSPNAGLSATHPAGVEASRELESAAPKIVARELDRDLVLAACLEPRWYSAHRDSATRCAMRAWPIPSGGGTVRHMVAASNGDLFLAESGVGKVARVQVKAGS